MSTTKKYHNMTKTTAFALMITLATSLTAFAQIQTTGVTTTAVHIADGSGVVLDSGDYYGSGNDDNFAEYGVTTFNVTEANATSVDSATLILTYNDRSFSDGSEVEFFFSPDSAATLGGDFADLSYDPAFVNGINPAHFATAPISLGTHIFTPSFDGGTPVAHFLDISVAKDAMLSAIQSGSDFQILIASTASDADITFSGVGNTFDPGDPQLNLNVSVVPEPTSIGLLAIGLLAVGGFRRRR